MLVASIPSPSDPFIFHLGGLAPRWYGVLLAAGILIAILVTRRQLALRGRDPAIAGEVALWAVPFGVVGARLYHVVTDWSAFSGHLSDIPLIQKGGLGIYGAILGGALGAAIATRRAGVPLLVILDCAAPGTALAQALGRFGNYANQELFGGPTNLPWGLEIDPQHRPAQYLNDKTFQPTFLYESIWDLIVMVILLRVAKRWRRQVPGYILALYLALYSFGRFFVEGLRVDPAHEIGPFRLNQVVAAAVFAVALAVLIRLRGRA
ncbi:MAG TPA: prolipoprotein diacylglyceryl transferase, partial [Gaiellales bacterium]|nr:prolipoprotein diacylglyceryl transferase [Gaiellales bacterium]